ncbi:hypothetical protein EVAR_56148_1 [Eumeta japonica]|uniref:Uncharacterized protein n=1 Tax=Eumeta variegata TaxID=151549 RepID=A0A4C1Y2P5_EUMVA|nr:hypothetical protein EVAR_56148_1 [Eumeta japonica]
MEEENKSTATVTRQKLDRANQCSHGRAYEAYWYGRPPRSTDAECNRRRAPTTLRTTRGPPGHNGNDIVSRTDASGDSSSTELTTLTRA